MLTTKYPLTRPLAVKPRLTRLQKQVQQELSLTHSQAVGLFRLMQPSRKTLH
jgi:hypothetical protein